MKQCVCVCMCVCVCGGEGERRAGTVVALFPIWPNLGLTERKGWSRGISFRVHLILMIDLHVVFNLSESRNERKRVELSEERMTLVTLIGTCWLLALCSVRRRRHRASSRSIPLVLPSHPNTHQ